MDTTSTRSTSSASSDDIALQTILRERLTECDMRAGWQRLLTEGRDEERERFGCRERAPDECAVTGYMGESLNVANDDKRDESANTMARSIMEDEPNGTSTDIRKTEHPIAPSEVEAGVNGKDGVMEDDRELLVVPHSTVDNKGRANVGGIGDDRAGSCRQENIAQESAVRPSIPHDHDHSLPTTGRLPRDVVRILNAAWDTLGGQVPADSVMFELGSRFGPHNFRSP